MRRTLLYLLAGLVLGGIIHIAVILILPQFATRDIWSRVMAMDALEDMVVLAPVAPGADNPMQLDPALVYGVCRLSLAEAPGLVNGAMPLGFWSVAVYNDQGHVIYSTTNRSGSGQTIDMGIFNQAQTRLLAEQRIDIADGLLIVESGSDDIFVVMRAAPPHEAMRARFAEALDAIRCLNIR